LPGVTTSAHSAAGSPVLAELTWRGLLYQHTEELGPALAARSVSAYCGIDPSAASLHVGNLVPIMGLVHLQRAGHRPVALVGGGTGMIGDPSGKSSERQLLPVDVIDANAHAIGVQLERFLDFGGARPALLRNNAAWLRSLGAVEFLRDVGKHFSVNYMLAKDSVKTRLEAGISFTEFSYMLLQAYDFLELYRRDGVTLQLGGSDQWGNITAGIELIRRTDGAEAHALTLPLLTTASGAKFGKTEAGTVWLDPALTSPYRFYQFWLNADDRDVASLLKRFTLLSAERIGELDAAVAARPEAREAQRALALDVTARVHGEPAARVAEEVSDSLFGKRDPRALSAEALAALEAEIPFHAIERRAQYDAIELFVAAQLAPSGSAARRLLQQGGLSVNGERLAAEERTVVHERVIGERYFLLKKGARDFALVRTGD
jgi:tyrosyl-tRNA synthetase